VLLEMNLLPGNLLLAEVADLYIDVGRDGESDVGQVETVARL